MSISPPKETIFEKIIQKLFYLLFFATPLLLSPSSFEVFEFPKMLFVYLLTILIVGFWLIRQIKAGRIIFQKTFLDRPLLFFLLSQFISTLISIDRHTSIFGYYSRFHGGLLSTISYALLYWALVSNLNLEKRKSVIINSSLASAFLISIYAILQHFGLDKNIWIQDVQNRVFSTLGQPNWLAAYLSALIPFVILAFLSPSVKKPSLLYFTLLATYLLALLFTKSKSGFLAFLISSLFLFLFSFFKNKKTNFLPLFYIFLLFSSLFAIIGTPYTPPLKDLFVKKVSSPLINQKSEAEDMPLNITSSEDIRYIVWQGAINLWKKYPLLGTGTETFAYSYYWVRPSQHNLTSEWDFLYNKAHNEYLNFLATTGILGLFAHLFLLASIILRASKKPLNSALLASCLAIIISNFFGFSIVTIGLLFFSLPSLLVSTEDKKYSQVSSPSLKKDLLLLLTGLFFFKISFNTISYYRADYHYNQSRKYHQIGQNKESLFHIEKAISLFPSEPNYYSEASLIYSQIAFLYFQENPSSDQIEKYIALALKNSQQSTDISPFHPNLLKTRAQLLYTLVNIDSRYMKDLIATMNLSIKLAPTDAKSFYNLALIYQLDNQPQKAKETFLKTLDLKKNYDQAHFSLAQIYENENDFEEAKKHYQAALNINPQNESAREKLKHL